MLYLELKNLTIKYGSKAVITDVNFKLHQGEKVGIIGKNGAGKTTLVETIMGTNRASISGTIDYYDGIKNDIKAVFQEYEFDRGMPLRLIYKIYALIAGIKPEKDIKQLFSYFGLQGLVNSHYDRLSGGQKQKFKLLMGLALKPRLIILDEITTSLDVEWRHQIFNILNDYFLKHPNCSLILVSHDYKELIKLTSHQYLIENKTLKPIDNLSAYFHEDIGI